MAMTALSLRALELKRQSSRIIRKPKQHGQSCGGDCLQDVAFAVLAEADFSQAAGIVGEHGETQHHPTVNQSGRGSAPVTPPEQSSSNHEKGSGEVIERRVRGGIDNLG